MTYTVRSRWSLDRRRIRSSQLDTIDPSLMPAPRTFKSAMEMLHWALANGMFKNERYINRTPRTPGEISTWHGNDAHRAYKVTGDWPDWELTTENYDAMVSAALRYREIIHYYREIEPEWTYLRTVEYMDNSTEITEVNKYGETRVRMTVAPHGDICF